MAPGIDDAGFFPARGNLVRWGDGPLRRADFAPGAAGHHVVRDVFDALLLDFAEEAGADVRRNATVRRVILEGADSDREGEQLQRVEYENHRGIASALHARLVLDCSGRSGVIANPDLRVHDQTNATVALAGVWRANAGESPAEPYTLVESYRDGWAWSMPVSDTRRYLTMMIDPRRTGLLKGRGRRSLYLAEVEKTREARRLVAAARLVSDISGHTASQYAATRFAGDGFLLVGDAASFVDPLASVGVKKALASAWLASVVVHTCISTPDMRDVALEFFESRERATWLAHRRHTAQFYQEAASAHGHGFWSARAMAADDISGAAATPALDPAAEVHIPVPTEPDIAALRQDPDVLRAFGDLRAAPSIRLRPAPGLRRLQLPAVRGRRIVLDEHLASPELPEGVRFLRDVDLPPLVEMAGKHHQVPDLYEAYLDRVAAVSLPDFLGALSVLLGKGMLKNDDDSTA